VLTKSLIEDPELEKETTLPLMKRYDVVVERL
jgi:hypothetical protein